MCVLATISSSVYADTIDSFNRTNRNLNGDEADNGETWASSSTFTISDNEIKGTAVTNTESAGLYLGDRYIDNGTNVSFEVGGISGSATKRVLIRLFSTDNITGIRLVLGKISSGNSIYIYDGINVVWVEVCTACIYDSTDYKIKISDINVSDHTFNIVLDGFLYNNGGNKFRFGSNTITYIDKIFLGGYTVPSFTIDEMTIDIEEEPCIPVYEEVLLVDYRNITYCHINNSLTEQKYFAYNNTCEEGLINYTYENRDVSCTYKEPFHFNDYETNDNNWTGGIRADALGHNSNSSYKIENLLAGNYFYNVSQNGSTRMDFWFLKTSHTGITKFYFENSDNDYVGMVWLNESILQIYEEGVAKEVPFDINVWYPVSWIHNVSEKNATFYFNDTLLSNNALAYPNDKNLSVEKLRAIDSSETTLIDDFRLFNEEYPYTYVPPEEAINETETEDTVLSGSTWTQNEKNMLLLILLLATIISMGIIINNLIIQDMYSDFIHYIIIIVLMILSAGVWITELLTEEIRLSIIFIIALIIISLIVIKLRLNENESIER